MQQRLQKLLAAAGIASRRSSETLITAGRVSVNGQTVTDLGAKADPETDDIRVDGQPLKAAAEKVYLVLNKPTGYVSTVRDPHAAHTVMDLVGGAPGRVYPVGRLDADSAGLLLLTNDGDFTQKLTHPSHQAPKTYRAVVRGLVPEWAGADLRKGVLLDDGMTAPAQVEWVDYDERNNASIIDVTIHEGRNRQVRRMFEAVGFPVLALTRIAIGPIALKGIAPGTWRKLHPREVAALLASADSTPLALPQRPPDEAETGKLGNQEIGKQGDHETGKRGNRETGTRAEREARPMRGAQAPRATGKPTPKAPPKPVAAAPPKPVARPAPQSGPRRAARPGEPDPAILAAARALTQQLRADRSDDDRDYEPERPASKTPHAPKKPKRPTHKPKH